MIDDHGVIAAAVTPRGKRGDIDFGAAFELIDHFCRAGLQGIAFFTAAGEYPAFGLEERTRLVYLAAKRSRIAVYAGAGSMSVDESVHLAREACSAGAVGVLAPPPHFYTYSQEEIGEFYLEFSRQTPKDLAIYISNTPSVTTPIEPETALRLLETGRFAGIEDPGAEESRIFAHGSFAWLAGGDSTAARARIAGAHGIVSAAANAAPELLAALDCAVRSGDASETARLDAMLHEFEVRVRGFIPPAMLKVAAEMRGIKLGAAASISVERQRAMDEFREWFRGWLPVVKNLTAHV
jgi:dihydrodipicolinate synthase/N-acetylneuraminate lyase